MFNKFFKKNKTQTLDNNHMLIAALLIHAAKIDENYTNIEKNIIKKALINLYNLKTIEVEKLL